MQKENIQSRLAIIDWGFDPGYIVDAITKGFQSAPNGDFQQETAQWIVYRAYFRR